MPLTLIQRLELLMRGVPARPIAIAMSLGAGVEGAPRYEELVAHALAGRDVVQVIEALAMAASHKLPVTWLDVAAIDLAGRDVRTVMATVCEVHEAVIETVAPGDTQPILQNLADGSAVRVRIHLVYHPSPGFVAFGGGGVPGHAVIASACASALARATSLMALEAEREQIEATIHDAAADCAQFSRLITCGLTFVPATG